MDVNEKEKLKITNLNVYYKQKKEGLFSRYERKQVLKNVSISMKAGEILGLAGESGSGKSTLAKTILGITDDVEGEIINEFKDPQMIFQDPYSSLNPAKKIGWLLEEPLRLDTKKSWSAKEREDRVKQVMTRVELDHEFLDRYPGELSGGQRQRVAIGAALVRSPEILIADEPVSALDVTIQAGVLELLKAINKDLGISILFISHDLRVIYNLCDRVAVMYKGEIIEEGTPKDVYFNPRHDYTKQLVDATVNI